MRRGILLLVLTLFVLPCFAEVRTKTYTYKTASIKFIWNDDSFTSPGVDVDAEVFYRDIKGLGWDSALRYVIFLNPKKNSNIDYYSVTLYTAPSVDTLSSDYYRVVAGISKDKMAEKDATKSFYSFQFNEARQYFNDLKMPYEMLCELESHL